MKRSLAMTVLALGLIAFGCDDEPAGTPDTGVAGRGGSGGSGGTGGTGGSGGTGGTGGTGGSGATGGTGGRAADAGRDVAAAERPRDSGVASDRPRDSGGADRAGDTRPVDMSGGAFADICSAYKGGGSMAGISAGDFCGQFMVTCSFGTKNRFANMGDCVSKYAATGSQSRRAGALCDARAGLGMVNCDRAAGFGLNAK